MSARELLEVLSSARPPVRIANIDENLFHAMINRYSAEKKRLAGLILSPIYAEQLSELIKKINMKKSPRYILCRVDRECRRVKTRRAAILSSYIMNYIAICGYITTLHANRKIPVEYDTLEL